MNTEKTVTEIKRPKKTKGLPDKVDKHVGGRLRVRRMLLNISQEKLADAVDLTFQQVQKYERGLNRISAGRLYQFSNILDIPVSFFFDNMAPQSTTPNSLSDNDQNIFQIEKDENIMSNKETVSLLRAYYSIQDAGARKDILKFIKSMSQKMSS